MIALLPALSLSNKLLEVGALAAFAALVGIAIVSLLVFSQARELKRLREWAGRAPERAAELEQRVAAEAAMRDRSRETLASGENPRFGQRPVQPVVPRATPMIARQIAGQPPATALTAAGQPAAVPGQPAAVPAPTVAPLPAPVPGQPAFVPTAQTVAGAAQAGAESAPVEEQKPADEPEPVGGAKPEDVRPAPAAAEAPKPAPAPDEPEPVIAGTEPTPALQTPELQPPEAEPAVAAAAPGALAPATVAAAAASTAVASRVVDSPPPAAPRAPVPPAPAKIGIPPAPPAPPVQAAVSSKPLPPRPPAPVAPRASAHAGSVRALGRDGGASGVGGGGPKFLVEEEPSSRKTVALIVGGVVVGVAVLAAIVLSSGGGSNSPSTGTTARSTASGGHHEHVVVANPAETHVVVLNATEAEGLAHKLAGNLRQSGYTQAAASSAKPPSARSTSVVEYASGHRTEAQRVGQTLGIGEVTPIEGAVASAVNGASVVVIAGADKESLVGSANREAPSEGAAGGSAGAGEAQGNEAPANEAPANAG
jgi:hypothetical protein